MGPSESSDNSLLFIINALRETLGERMGKFILKSIITLYIPKVSKEVGGILKFQYVHKSPPHTSLFYQKMTLVGKFILKSIIALYIPKVSNEVGGILKFQYVHKSPPSYSPILPKDDSCEIVRQP